MMRNLEKIRHTLAVLYLAKSFHRNALEGYGEE